MTIRGVMTNYFEVQVWKALRNALQNGYEDFVWNEDVLQVAIDLCDQDADIEKYMKNDQFSINSVITAVEAFRKYHGH